MSIKSHQIKILAVLPVTLIFYLLFSMISISISQVLLSISLLCWLILLLTKKQKFLVPPFFWAMAVYCILSLISSFLSVNPEVSLKDCRELLLFLIIPMVYTGFSREKEIKNASLALLASGYISILCSIFYFIFKASPGERVAGFMGHYMTQAGLLLLFSTMALSMFLFYRNRVRFLWGLGFLLSTIALIFTLTRCAWIGIIVASLVLLFLYKPKALIIIPLAVGLIFLLSPKNVKKRALSTFSFNGYSNTQRIEYLHAGIKIIKDFPLFGTGPDTVDMVFQNPKYGLSEEAKRNVHLHNNFTQIAAERGIPTLLAWLVFMIWIFISLIKLIKTKDSSVFPFAAASLAALLALITAGIFEYNFGDSEITSLFLYMMAVPFTLERILKDKTQINEEK